MTEPSYHYTLDRDGRMAPAYTLSDLEALKRDIRAMSLHTDVDAPHGVGLFQQASRPTVGGIHRTTRGEHRDQLPR